MVKRKACVFISGSGTNLKSIIKSTRDYNFPINIELVISNKKNAKGIDYAKKYSIPYRVITSNKKKFEELAIQIIRLKKIEIICLAGFMKILSKSFIRKFKGKILNIHPSLLPKFKGLDTFNRVLKAKEKFTGCTVHFVDEKLDNGKIIIKRRIEIKKNFNQESLKKNIQIEEYKAYSQALRKVYEFS
tara:strand:+ start:1767 stop:2330 length:564 start_codon:yes stop_codon:yes gene_type:complete